MADFDVGEAAQFQSAEAVGMKRAREDGFEGAAPTGQQSVPSWPGYPGEIVYRLVVPANRVGLIIGKKGVWIKNLCQETGARVKVMEAIQGTEERGVLVSARENYNLELPPAVVALLKVHDRAVLGGADEEDQQGRPPPPIPETATAKLLIPQVQAGTLIGKGGGTIKSMQEQTRASIKVLQESEFVRSDIGLYALPDDRLVEISGPVAAVQTALRVCALQLRKYLVDRSAVPHLEHPERSRPSAAPSGGGAQYNGGNAGYNNGGSSFGGGGYGQQGGGGGGYGSQPSQFSGFGQADPYGAVAPISQIVQKMTVPIAYTDTILGQGGSRLAQIRSTSGATVTVTMADGNMNLSFEITGTQSQVATAQRLIENFMSSGLSVAAASAGGYGQQQQQGYYNAPATGGYDQAPATNYASQYSAQPQAAQYSQYGQY